MSEQIFHFSTCFLLTYVFLIFKVTLLALVTTKYSMFRKLVARISTVS